MRNLQTVGVLSQSYESWLTPKILQCIPEELRISLMRTLQGTWSLDVLFLEGVEIRVRYQRTMFFAVNKNEPKLEEAARVSPKQYQSTTGSLFSTQIGKTSDIFQYVPFAMESILHINATSSTITERGGIL